MTDRILKDYFRLKNLENYHDCESDHLERKYRGLADEMLDILKGLSHDNFVESSDCKKEDIAALFDDEIDTLYVFHSIIDNAMMISFTLSVDDTIKTNGHVLIRNDKVIFEIVEGGHLEFGTHTASIHMSDGEYDIPDASPFPEEIYGLLLDRTKILAEIPFDWEKHREYAVRVYNYIGDHDFEFNREEAAKKRYKIAVKRFFDVGRRDK